MFTVQFEQDVREDEKGNWLAGDLLAAFATAGVVMIVRAAIPDPNGVIYACYRSNGNLCLVDKSSCTGNETAISWSQSGPLGPQGCCWTTGRTGTVGCAGTSGSSWAAGRSGTGRTWTAGLACVVWTSRRERLRDHQYSSLGTLPTNGTTSVVATCPSGKRVLGGGYVAPSKLDTAPLSRPEADNAARTSRVMVAAGRPRFMRYVLRPVSSVSCPTEAEKGEHSTLLNGAQPSASTTRTSPATQSAIVPSAGRNPRSSPCRFKAMCQSPVAVELTRCPSRLALTLQ